MTYAHNPASTLATVGPWDLELRVPLIPPSVNHYKVRRFYNSKEAKAYIDAVCIFGRGQKVAGDFFEIEIDLWIVPANFLARDLDNFLKVAIDALVTAGVIPNDRFVREIRARKVALASGGAIRDEQTIYRIRGTGK